MQQEIFTAIQKALEALGLPAQAGTAVDFVVERPSEMSRGDYATNAALVAGKQLSKNSKDFAQELHKVLGTIAGVEKVEIAGPGFLNFFLTREAIVNEVEKAATDESWGTNDVYKGKTVMVEYTDPNPFKEFHIGHLMSNTIGESIARTLENAGAKVIRANYQGDVGPHVAKAVWMAQSMINQDPKLKEKLHNLIFDLGFAYQSGSQEYETNPQAKKAIDEINKKIYEKTDDEINYLYQLGRKQSLKHFEEIYRILGTTFTHYFFESETWPIGAALVQAHIKDGVFEKSDGAVVFKGEKVGLHTRVFINSQGLPTYEAKDLGLLELKTEKEPYLDESVTITASEQNEYFKVVLAAAKEIPELQDVANKTKHISHGMMRFASGKMSSRRGNVITGESLLADLQEAAKEKMQGRELQDAEKIAEQVAVGAIKYAVLKQGSGKDIVFDPGKSLSLEGDSGPYLQYAHIRAASLLRGAKEAGVKAARADAPAQGSELERVLVHFSEVVERAARELEPHYVTTYLTELASAFNSWYVHVRVIGGEYPSYALLLATAVEQTLRKGLTALGIPVPEEM